MAVAPQPRLVVLRALGLGDLLASVPALRALARAFPRHRRLLAAPAALAPLAALVEADGEAAMHTVVDARSLGRPPARALRGADAAANLHGRGPQSHRLLLAARPRRLLAFRHPDVPGSAGMPAWRPGEREPERWCRLLAELGIPADPGELRLRAPAIAPPEPARGATQIHPGAASGARRWPPQRWAAVARAEAAAGRPVAITGAPGERGLAERVAELAGIPPEVVLAGRTDLLDLAAAVAAASRLACGDTGVAHLATALGTPSVVLFGPVPPSEWGPPPGPRHVALWAGRRGDPHAREPDPGLLRIGVEEVCAALAALTGAEAAA